MADDECQSWTKAVVDNIIYDDNYLLWLVHDKFLTNPRWRLPICRTINRETLFDLIGIVIDG